MAYTYPGQVFANRLTVLSGYDAVSILNIWGTLTSNVNINSTGNPATAGRVVHVQSATQRAAVKKGPPLLGLEMGAKSTGGATGYMMPLFLWSGSDQFDVQLPGIAAGNPLGGSVSTPPDFLEVIPSGTVLAFPATASLEIEVTGCFDTAQTYVLGQLLRCVTSNTDVNAGNLTNQNAGTNQTYTGANGSSNSGYVLAGTDTTVGVVSRGAYTNSYNQSALSLWQYFLPGTR